MEKWETAWLAGIFEGEGSITFTGRNGVRVSLGMTDEDVIDSFERLFPAGNTFRYEPKNRIKPLYVWRIDNRDNVARFLELVLPFLHDRRGAKAKAALERLKNNPGAHGEQTHCKYGHPFDAENTYSPQPNRRICRTCARRRDEARPKVRVPKTQGICESCGQTFYARHGTRWCSKPCYRTAWRAQRRAAGLPVP